MQSGPDNSLKDVALEILQNGVATVPIIHSPAQDGSYPQLLYLASLSEILKRELLIFLGFSLILLLWLTALLPFRYLQVFQAFSRVFTNTSVANWCNSFGHMGSENWRAKSTTPGNAEAYCFSECSIEFVSARLYLSQSFG